VIRTVRRTPMTSSNAAAGHARRHRGQIQRSMGIATAITTISRGSPSFQ
jgi:hypothetical protein